MSTAEVVLALLRGTPRHGYDVKRGHDEWFPDVKALAVGQVYSTLARLERDGAVEVVGTEPGGGPDRTVYALTADGERRLAQWLTEAAPAAGTGAEEVVRKTVAVVRTGGDAVAFVGRQRAAHLRRMRELSTSPPEGFGQRLARDHQLRHLDADLQWLDQVLERIDEARDDPGEDAPDDRNDDGRNDDDRNDDAGGPARAPRPRG